MDIFNQNSEEDIMKFEKLINQYSNKIIDSKKMYEEIRNYFTLLLKNNKFNELDYLKIYPFISELQDEDLFENNILDSKISEISDIISGEKAFIYGLWIKLVFKDMDDILNIWDMYKRNKFISFEKLLYVEKKLIDVESK